MPDAPSKTLGGSCINVGGHSHYLCPEYSNVYCGVVDLVSNLFTTYQVNVEEQRDKVIPVKIYPIFLCSNKGTHCHLF
jgi:hypothetical protein